MLSAMNGKLNDKQKMALEELQQCSRDHHVRDRIRCVLHIVEGYELAQSLEQKI